jgi:peptidoglycan/LPS O-acetylase OafA/YrhL
MRFRADIEGLRAVAVALVVFNHLDLLGFSGGYVGVDIFFVTSGYLITSLLVAEYRKNAASSVGFGWISLPAFYFRRARRILPVALLVLIVTVIASYLMFNSARASEVFRDALWSAIFASNFHFMSVSTDYFQQGFSASPLQHFWSLAVEEQFYLIFPALFLLSVKIHGLSLFGFKLWWNRRLIVMIALIVSGSFMWSIIATNASPQSAYFSSLTRAWQLGIGALLALLLSSATFELPQRFKQILGLGGLSLICVSALLFDDQTPFPGFMGLIPSLGAASFIAAGHGNGTSPISSKILGVYPFRFVGKISYSVYLWHWPLIVLGGFKFPELLENNLYKTYLCLFLVVISTASYFLVEKPFRQISVPESFEVNSKLRASKNFSFKDFSFKYIAVVIVAALTLSFVTFVYFAKPKSQLTQEQISAFENEQLRLSQPSENLSSGEENDNYSDLLKLWQQKLSDGLSLTKIPQDIKPPLSAQSGQAPGEWAGCLNSQIPSCTSGDLKAEKTAVVVGDSYGSSIFPMVTESLDKSNWKVVGIFRGQCMVSDVVPIINGKKDNECAKFRQKWFSYLRDTKPDLVILADNSDVSISLPANYPNELEFWQIRLEESLKLITSASKNVVYFTSPPRQKALRDCVLADGSIGVGCVGKGSTRNTKRQVAGAVTQSFGGKFIDSREWVCVFQGCPAIVESVAVYVDGTHMSRKFALALAPLFRAWLIKESIG